MYDRGTDPATSRASNDAQSTLKQHVYQIRLLTSDNQIKTQQLDILKEKVKELEDVNAIYQKQIANMETKMKYYDQEIKLKYQSSEEKSVKLTQNNQYLYKKNQQLQARVKELEDKIRSYEQEISMNSADADHLRRKLAEAEEQLEKSRDKKKRKTYEMDRLSETNQQMSAENQDLNRTISHLKQDNDRLLRTIEENEHQLKKFSLVQQQYQDLKSMHENEFAESRALKQSYDLLKQKYDEVYYNYNISLLNKRNDESDTETNRAKVMELEQELEHLDAILRRKDKEITHLAETVRDLDHQLKDKDIRYETEVKQIVNLIDGQTTNFDYGSQEESVAIRLLVDNIIRQNREFVRISDKTKMSAQDGKEMKVNLNRLNEEKNNLKNEIEDLQKENESLRMRLQSTINDSLHNINLAQTSFEERLNEMVNIQKEGEERYNEQLQQKDGEVAYFQELLNAAEEKVRKVEDDRDRTVEFLREQEMEIKEFKMKFFQIAEETSHQKNRLNVTAYVLSSFLKIFFNLISKFDGLVQQKSFLSPYFYQYEKIKDKLTEMQLIRPRAESQRERSGIYQRFRKVVITVMAALRLRNLQLRNGGIKYDTFDVRHNLTNCSEGLKRFIIDLFRGGKFVINRDLVTSVDDILRNFESQSEDAIVSKIIVAASQYNDIPYEPELTVRRKRTRDLQLEDLTSNFRLKDDFDYRLQALDGKLRLAEEHILKQEDKFREELGELTDKLREVRLENETYKREKERIHTDYHMAKEQIDTLLVLVDEKQSMMPEYLRRNRNLNEDYNILQDYVVSLVRKYDIARKELEEKDLRMVELERQLIQAGNEENLMMVHSTPINNVPRDKTPKVAGRIVSSGRKRNFNEL